MGVKTITAFETSDGSVFRYEEEANMHEVEETLKLRLNQFVKVNGERVPYDSDYTMSPEQLFEHREELLNILTGKE